MIDGVPEITDFEVTADTPRCPRCGGPMDQGNVRQISGELLEYKASVSPGVGYACITSARACIACGYTELYTDPADVRCVMAGIKPPKPAKKRDL